MSVETALRGAVMGTWLESPARFVWKRVLRRRTRNDVYDQLTAAIMRRTLRPGSHCVDIGCHAGAILDEMLRLAPAGMHYAFEPLPHLASALRQKYADQPHVVLHEMALSNAAGTATFHANRDHPGMSGLERRDYVSPHDRVELITVRTDRLDAMLPAGSRIDFIKIDVEGAESRVLEGAALCLHRDRPVVVFEHGTASREFYGAGSGVVFDLLAQAGLKVSLLEEYVRGGAPLGRADLIRQVEGGFNFYFVAHP